MVTQKQLVLKYMEDFGSISPLEAFKDLGITRLAARISDLKETGVKINSTTESAISRYGRRVHYSRYTLGGIAND